MAYEATLKLLPHWSWGLTPSRGLCCLGLLSHGRSRVLAQGAFIDHALDLRLFKNNYHSDRRNSCIGLLINIPCDALEGPTRFSRQLLTQQCHIVYEPTCMRTIPLTVAQSQMHIAPITFPGEFQYIITRMKCQGHLMVG